MPFFSGRIRGSRPFPSDGFFLPGQVWHYKTRPHEEASTALVLSVDITADGEPVVHVQVQGVSLKAGPGLQPVSVIGHMPLSSLSFERSVTALVTAFVKVPDHSEALTLWRQGGGGVWAISLASALDHLEATLTNPDRASRL